MKYSAILGIIIVAWLLIIAESYLFFGVIIPLGPGIHSIGSFTESALLKIIMTFALGVLWFAVNIYLTRRYVRSSLKRQLPSVSS